MRYTATILFLLFASFAFAADEPTTTDNSNAAQTRYFDVTLAIQNSGDFQTAADRWNSYLNDYPQASNIVQVRFNRGYCFYQIDQYEKAIQDLDAVMEVEKKSDIRENTLFYSAMSYKELGTQNASMFTQAKNRFETLFKEFPNTDHYAYAANGLGETYLALGDSQQALTMFQKVYTKFPLTEQGARAYIQAGKILYAQKADLKCANLMIEFQQKQKNSPLRFEAATLAGRAFLRTKYYNNAERQYAIASDPKAPGIENYPNVDYALYFRGVCFFSMKKYDIAITVFSDLITRFPQSNFVSLAELSTAESLRLLNKLEDSKEHYLKAASFPKTASDANFNLAWLYFKENDQKNAMDRINLMPASAFKPFSGMPSEQIAAIRSACKLRVQIYGHSSDIENQKTAVKYCDEIIAFWEKDSTALWATLYSAQIQYKLGNYQDCKARCEAILNKWPKSEEILEAQIFQADSLFNIKQYKESGQIFITLYKNYLTDTRRYEWLLQAVMSLDKLDKPQSIIKVLVPAIKNITKPSLREEALCYLGKAYLEVHDIPNAKAMLLQCQKEFPENPNMTLVLYYLGCVYREEQDISNAIVTFQKILDEFPQSSVEIKATLELALLKNLSGEYEKSLEMFDKIIAQNKENPYRPQAIINSAEISHQNGQLEQSITRTTLFITDYPDNDMIIPAYFVRAKSKMKQSKYDEALKDCQMAITIAQQKNVMDEWEIRLRSILVLCLAQSKDSIDQTITEFNNVQAAQKRLNTTIPEEDVILFWYGNALFNAKKLDNGKSSYETVFTQFPKSKYHFSCAVMLGQMAKESNDFNVAKNYLTQAISGADPASAIKAAKILGFIYLISKDYQMAYQNFDKSIQLYESNPQFQEDKSVRAAVQDARFQKAEILMLQGKYAEALTLYQNLTDIHEANQALAYLHASQCADKAEKLDVAMDFLNKALDENDNLKEELAKTSKQLEPALQEQRAWLLYKTGKEDKANTLFKRIVKENENLDPKQANPTTLQAVAKAWFHLGEYQMQLKKYPDAITLFYNVIFGYPFPELQADACYEAARCYESLKQPDNAKKMYKLLLEICPSSSKVDYAKSKLNQQ